MIWRGIGDVSYQTWRSVVRSTGGPEGLASEVSYEAAKPHSALILAMAGRECKWGTTENINKLSNRNVLNLKQPIKPDGTRLPGFMAFTTWDAGIKAARERITSTTYGNGIYVPTKTVFDLISVFAPSIENDVQGYVDFVESSIARWKTIPPATGGNPPMSSKLVIVVDAGHRSTDRSGNPAETALTGFMAADVVADLRTRGHEAYWYQRDLDRDSDPDETIGTLDTVASGIAAWVDGQVAQGKDVVFVSEHYNGANSRIHVIVPDNVGLVTRISGGAPSGDTAANNQLDMKLAAQIAQNYKAAGLGSLYIGRLGVPGIMSERETGVGLDGARLAVFAYTARKAATRAKLVRLVVENGGTADEAARRDDFTTKCAKAQADAIEKIYGMATEQPQPNPDPNPEPNPVPTIYPVGVDEALASEWFGSLSARGRRFSFNPDGGISQVWLANASKTGEFPRLVAYRPFDDGREYWSFANGLTIARLGEGKPLRVLGKAA